MVTCPRVVADLGGAGHGAWRLAERDRDDAECVGGYVEGLVHEDVRPVTRGELEGVGAGLNVVEAVQRLPEPCAECPLAETPLGLSGVKVTAPSSVPVTQNSGPVLKLEPSTPPYQAGRLLLVVPEVPSRYRKTGRPRGPSPSRRG